MFILASNTDHFQLLLAAPMTSANCPFVCSYVDHVITSGAKSYTPARTVGNTNGTTPVDTAPVPAATTFRQIKLLNVKNADSAPVTITARYNANGTTFDPLTVTLGVNETLQYNDGDGWSVIDAGGNIKGVGETGAAGAAGAAGQPGATGDTGQQGVSGQDGSTWLLANGPPSLNDGLPGDFALDKATGDFYRKRGLGFGLTTWDKQGSLRGPAGPRGLAGLPGQIGGPGPVGKQGDTGDPGGAITIPYIFTSAAGDPGLGKLGFDNVLQAFATTVNVSFTDAYGRSWGSILQDISLGGSLIAGNIRIEKVGDHSKYLEFSTTTNATTFYGSFPGTTGGHTVSPPGPFLDGDAVIFYYTGTGDKGDPGAAGATGAAGGTGAAGPAGTAGQGFPGQQGTPGEDGSMWFTAATLPNNAFGRTNDLVLLPNGQVYQKLAGQFGYPPAWTLVANILGPAGLTGAIGQQGFPGIGPVGPQGPEGSRWHAWPVPPMPQQGRPRDLAIITADGGKGDVYRKMPGQFGMPALWRKLFNLIGPPGPGGPQGATGIGIQGPQGPTGLPFPYIQLQDQKTSGTAGGTATVGAPQTRDLNTIVRDTHGLVTLAANQFTLPKGTWRIQASAPAYPGASAGGITHQVRLANITDSLVILGTCEYAFGAAAAGGPVTRSFVSGEFTIAGTKTFQIQHQVGVTVATNGFGVAVSFGQEIYTTVELWRIG